MDWSRYGKVESGNLMGMDQTNAILFNLCSHYFNFCTMPRAESLVNGN